MLTDFRPGRARNLPRWGSDRKITRARGTQRRMLVAIGLPSRAAEAAALLHQSATSPMQQFLSGCPPGRFSERVPSGEFQMRDKGNYRASARHTFGLTDQMAQCNMTKSGLESQSVRYSLCPIPHSSLTADPKLVLRLSNAARTLLEGHNQGIVGHNMACVPSLASSEGCS